MKTSTESTDPPETKHRDQRRGDPLSAMYVLAAIVMFIAFIVIILMMFVPSDWRTRFADEDAYVPGAGPAFAPLSRSAAITGPTGVRDLGDNRYEVVIEAYNWEFQPNVVRVPVGAEVTFRATARDEYHGIALIDTDIIMSLSQNEVAEATHTFTEPGEYLWVCSEYCGAGHLAMTGRVIVGDVEQ